MGCLHRPLISRTHTHARTTICSLEMVSKEDQKKLREYKLKASLSFMYQPPPGLEKAIHDQKKKQQQSQQGTTDTGTEGVPAHSKDDDDEANDDAQPRRFVFPSLSLSLSLSVSMCVIQAGWLQLEKMLHTIDDGVCVMFCACVFAYVCLCLCVCVCVSCVSISSSVCR